MDGRLIWFGIKVRIYGVIFIGYMYYVIVRDIYNLEYKSRVVLSDIIRLFVVLINRFKYIFFIL